MHKKPFFILQLAGLLVLGGAGGAAAQATSFEVETDPTAFFSNGYNFNFGYSRPHWAIRLVPYKAELPEFVHTNKGFKQQLLGVAADLDYFPRADNNGLLAGPVLIYSKDELTSRAGEKRPNEQFLAGLRLGYRVMPIGRQRAALAGVYFTPFVAPLLTVADDRTFADGTTFRYRRVQVWGGVHVGWRFSAQPSAQPSAKPAAQ